MSATKIKLLLVEDDPNLGYLLREYLSMNDFMVTLATTAEEGLNHARQDIFDLAILDVMLPDGNGFDLAKAMSQDSPNLPFLFLTARSLKVDVLKGFALGAVDYLKKPIDEEELVVRIKTLVTRLGAQNEVKNSGQEPITIGKYRFDSLIQELRLLGNDDSTSNPIISLSKRESDLLLMLAQNINQLVAHKDILVSLWGENNYYNKKSLNVFVSHLRKYLADDPSVSIENVHNKGFVLRFQEVD